MYRTLQAALSLTLLLSNAPAFAASQSCTESTFSKLLPQGASVEIVQTVASNGTFDDPASNAGEFGPKATQVPALCAVKINVPSSSSSSYNFGLFLPDNWNNRTMTAGNAGFGGGINWPDMGKFAHYGFATISTDTGHISLPFVAGWARNQPQKQLDWGYRALHGSVVLAKKLVKGYYSAVSKYNYFSSCSTGGRQALREIAAYPTEFDGVIAGAPAWWTTHLQLWSFQIGIANLPGNGTNHISDSLFHVIQAEILKQCDPQDGVTDGIIMDPYGCNFNSKVLLCNNSTSNCLSNDQLQTLQTLLKDWTYANGTLIFPHLALGATYPTLVGVTTEPSPFGVQYIENFIVNSTDYDYHEFNNSIVQFADAADPGKPTVTDFDILPFQKRGGKLIHYHGLADQNIATGSSIYYYDQVKSTLSQQGFSKIDSFYRLFLMPGMQHCTGTLYNAPFVIGQGQSNVPGSTYSVPGFMDAKHDVTYAIMKWVEQGIAPNSIIATKFNGNNANNGVQIQRPLCPYPKQAAYKGSGDVKVAANWQCSS